MRHPLNSLALDLAVSRASLAAIKAKARVPVSEEELRSAARLRDTLREQLAAWNVPTQIPEDLVPRDDMRHQLEEALGTLTVVPQALPVQDSELLSRLVALLDHLVGEGGLSEDDATNLLNGLLHLGGRSSETTNSAAVGLVYADAHA